MGHGAALKIISISRSAFSVLAFLAIAEIADGFSFYVFSYLQAFYNVCIDMTF